MKEQFDARGRWTRVCGRDLGMKLGFWRWKRFDTKLIIFGLKPRQVTYPFSYELLREKLGKKASHMLLIISKYFINFKL